MFLTRATTAQGKLISGNTELGIEARFQMAFVSAVASRARTAERCALAQHPTIIHTGSVAELTELRIGLEEDSTDVIGKRAAWAAPGRTPLLKAPRVQARTCRSPRSSRTSSSS
jgi:hypothetical protein